MWVDAKMYIDENNFYLLRIYDFGLIWLSNLLTTSVSDEGYSMGGLWAGKKLCLYCNDELCCHVWFPFAKHMDYIEIKRIY